MKKLFRKLFPTRKIININIHSLIDVVNINSTTPAKNVETEIKEALMTAVKNVKETI